MYKFKPATDRIWKMRQLIRDRSIRVDGSLVPLFTEADKKYFHAMPIIKKGLITLEVTKQMEVSIEDFEIVVGSKGKYFCGSSYDPRSGFGFALQSVKNGEWTMRDDGLYHTPVEDEIQMCIAPEDVKILEEHEEYWSNRWFGAVAQASAPDGYEDFRRLNASDYGELPILMLPAGHLIAGYKKIINTGYAAIQKVADDWIEEHKGYLMGEDANKYPFYKAASLMCQAASELCLRYAEAVARKRAETTDEARLKELDMMEDTLLWISKNPARNFFDAVQLYMMYQNFIQLFDSYPSPSLGRFDQYVWPYLKKDLEAGTITEEYAQEIVDSFFLKANCFYQGGKGRLAQTTGIGNTYQHTTLGGVDPETG
ncbi:MAG: hypothetical protein HUJ65_05340, partial [Oscillospiraceae bacterium]|nr:hypothetical protein [Oscillospiraceae bacterium]